MRKSSSNDFPLYGMEAIISTIDDENELLDAFRMECKKQRKNLNYLVNEQRHGQGNINKKRKNKNIIKLSAASNISMD